jgi:hypothetical protein
VGATVDGGAQTKEETLCDAEAAEGLVQVGESSGVAEAIRPAFVEAGTLMQMGGNPINGMTRASPGWTDRIRNALSLC